MLFINPDECIDCDACARACPAEAIFIEDEVPTQWAEFIHINAVFPYAGKTPVTSKNDVTKGENWAPEVAARGGEH